MLGRELGHHRRAKALAVVEQAGGLSSLGVSFHLPLTRIVVFGWVAVAAGIAAAVFPARRAARLNVLEALQYE